MPIFFEYFSVSLCQSALNGLKITFSDNKAFLSDWETFTVIDDIIFDLSKQIVYQSSNP